MFETFGVPGLYIAVQAVLALAASWSAKTVCCRISFYVLFFGACFTDLIRLYMPCVCAVAGGDRVVDEVFSRLVIHFFRLTHGKYCCAT